MLPQAIFVRHSESSGNKGKLMKGIRDYPTDAAGKAESKKIAQRVAALKPDLVISSPLQRALEPAKAIAKKAGIPLQISDDFLPIDLGALHGKKMEEGEPKLKAAIDKDPDAPVAKGGESFTHFLKKKVRPGFKKIKELMAQGKRPVVVTHSRNLRELRYGLFGAKPADPTKGGPEPGGFVTLRGRRLQLHHDGGNPEE